MVEKLGQNTDEPISTETAKSSHLVEGFKPIIACVGTREQYGEETIKTKGAEKVSHNVNYEGDPEDLNESGFENAGKFTYVISPIDAKPKFTEELIMCTSLIAVGCELGTGEELSLLTHQDPRKIVDKKRWVFISALTKKLEELKKRCSVGSIDVVIVGGQFNPDDRTDDYRRTLAILNSVVREVLGFEPLVICGPKDYGGDDVYFDTPKRRIYIFRPNQDSNLNPNLFNDSFNAGDLGKMKEKWRGSIK